MSTRIGSSSIPNVQGYDGSERADEARRNVAAQQIKKPNAAEYERFLARSNNHEATTLGRVGEEGIRRTVEQMPPGAKLEVSGEAKMGHGACVSVKVSYEIERLEDGRYEVSRSIGGGFEVSEDGGVAKVGGKLGADLKTTWRFETAEGAADAVSTLAQKDLVTAGGDEALFDPALGARVQALDRRATVYTAQVKGELFGEAKLAAGMFGGEGEVQVASEPEVKVDLEKGTVVLEEAVNFSGRLTAKLGLQAKVVESSAGTDALAVSASHQIETTFTMTDDQRARFAKTMDVAILREVVQRGATEQKLVQRLEVLVAGQSATATRELKLTDKTQVLEMLDPRRGELEWKVQNDGTFRQKDSVDLQVAELEVKTTLRLPGEILGKGKLEDVSGLLHSAVSAEHSLNARRAQANIDR